jgi:8-oxo-dGTP pyrophosphatase MutT (NUDIX family)
MVSNIPPLRETFRSRSTAESVSGIIPLMSEAKEHRATSASETTRQRPRDAATLIVVRHDGKEPRVLLGQRHADHAFMPNKYVFPGGRLDAADCRLQPRLDLHPEVLAKLMYRMRGRASATRARGLAVAAVRETFEETGLLFADAEIRDGLSWHELIALGMSPNLSGLRYFARAITPPGRSRRFDSRFFVADARQIANLDRPSHTGSDELLEPRWFTFNEAKELDLPGITRDILTRLALLLAQGREIEPAAAVSFQYQKARRWREDTL